MIRFSASLVFLCILAAGCTAPAETVHLPEPDDAPSDTLGVLSPDAAVYRVSCRVTSDGGNPLSSAHCVFADDVKHFERLVDQDGVALVHAVQGTRVGVTATAPGHAARSAEVEVAGNMRLTFALEPVVPVQPPTPPNASVPAREVEPEPVPPVLRPWGAAVNVSDLGFEPHLVVAPSGTIYYAPTTSIYEGLRRSRDGGATWESIEPEWMEALPTLISDASISVAPDGSLWYARYWGFTGPTLACTSLDEGDSWTCDNAAIPGATDRMWVAGVNKDVGFVHTRVGLFVNTYAKTETGSQKYVPWGVEDQLYTNQAGNMVVDPDTGAVYQVMHHTYVLFILRIDDQLGVIQKQETTIPATKAIPWLSLREGVMWTTGEPQSEDGTRSLILARSTDHAETWTQYPIQSEAKSITFSYAAAGPDGRVAAVYYGSDQSGPPTDNGGTWGLYVVESDNGLEANPVWIERQVVEGIHVGNICNGLNCQEAGDDPEARFSGDLIGSWIDNQGLVHVAYNDDTNPGMINRYIRQVPDAGDSEIKDAEP